MRALARLLGVLLIAVVIAPAPVRAAPTPTAVVRGLTDALIAVMQDGPALGFQGRWKRLAPVIVNDFDLPLIARISLGRYWAPLDEGKRKRLIDALTRRTIATYAARFDAYSGEHFRILGEEPAPRGTMLVRTELVKSGGDAVALNYLLRKAGDRWRVVDVYLKGVYSELALRRSEYTATLKNHGFDALIAAIDRKTRDYAAGKID